MINSIFIFVQRLNCRDVRDGQHILAVVEFLATVAIVAIIRNT